jgi:hypothetical protein
MYKYIGISFVGAYMNCDQQFWLNPEVAVAESFGFNAAQLNALARIVRQERRRIERAWNGYFGQGGQV